MGTGDQSGRRHDAAVQSDVWVVGVKTYRYRITAEITVSAPNAAKAQAAVGGIRVIGACIEARRGLHERDSWAQQVEIGEPKIERIVTL